MFSDVFPTYTFRVWQAGFGLEFRRSELQFLYADFVEHSFSAGAFLRKLKLMVLNFFYRQPLFLLSKLNLEAKEHAAIVATTTMSRNEAVANSVDLRGSFSDCSTSLTNLTKLLRTWAFSRPVLSEGWLRVRCGVECFSFTMLHPTCHECYFNFPGFVTGKTWKRFRTQQRPGHFPRASVGSP